MQTIICELESGVHVRGECYFHKVVVRAPRNRVSATKERELRKHCRRLKVLRGRQVNPRFVTRLVELYLPTTRALKLAEKLGPISELEIALDIIIPDYVSKQRLKDRFDRHHIQDWHSGRKIVHYPDARYSGPKKSGNRFVWYVDWPSKVSGSRHCMHIEARYLGVADVRRIKVDDTGVRDTGDLIEIDPVAFWNKQAKLFSIDLQRLGRFHRNKVSGRRRRSSSTSTRNGFSYDVDQRTGGMLFHIFGVEPGNEFRSVQAFINGYGRGPYLRRMEKPLFMSDNQSFIV